MHFHPLRPDMLFCHTQKHPAKFSEQHWLCSFCCLLSNSCCWEERVLKWAKADERIDSEWWQHGERWRQNEREEERKMEEWYGARSLIPAIVRGAVLLMCWGSHIVTEIFRLSRPVCMFMPLRIYVCMCVCACACNTSLLSTHKSHMSVTSISQGAQSRQWCLCCTAHTGWTYKQTHTHTHTLVGL